METMDQRTRGDSMTDSELLSGGEVAAYLDGRLEGEELARVEEHLASNPSARQELIEASRIVASTPAREQARFRWLPATAGLAAIAALMLIAVRPRTDPGGASTVSTERRAPVEQFDRIDLVSPLEGQSLDVAAASFAWRSIEGATYRLVVSNASGQILLQRNTTDTLVNVARSLLTNGSGTYYWSVDALAPDGSSVTSGVREFVVTAH